MPKFNLKTIEIPIKFLKIDKENCHIIIKARINGKKANILIDTGASKTVFDFNRIHLFQEMKEIPKVLDIHSAGLGTNSLESRILNIDLIELGKLELKNTTVCLLDMKHVNDTYEKMELSPIDGVLGGDILKKYKAIISYKHKKLLLEK